MRRVGTVSRGIRCPIIREGDDVCDFVVDSVLQAGKDEGFSFHNRDVVCMTEAIVARAQGNYATVDQIAKDIREKFPGGVVGLYNPILSRNRFALNLKAVARASKKVIIQLDMPADEMGNRLVSQDLFEEKGVEVWCDVLTEEDFRKLFGHKVHHFTGVDYIQLYRDIVEAEDCQVEIILAHDPRVLLDYCQDILTCDVHTRKRTKRIYREAGAKTVYNLEDILTKPVDGSGYNPEYGLLGDNKATEEKVKLFPKDCQETVDRIAQRLKEETGKDIEAMIYGDGAFRDPVGHIWELADPVVSPAYTQGLEGVPNEVKLKYLADNEFANVSGQELEKALRDEIAKKDKVLKGKQKSEGTTPRRITDLLGSLADLTSGSGDKGTPVVLIQGYFDNLSDQ